MQAPPLATMRSMNTRPPAGQPPRRAANTKETIGAALAGAALKENTYVPDAMPSVPTHVPKTGTLPAARYDRYAEPSAPVPQAIPAWQ